VLDESLTPPLTKAFGFLSHSTAAKKAVDAVEVAKTAAKKAMAVAKKAEAAVLKAMKVSKTAKKAMAVAKKAEAVVLKAALLAHREVGGSGSTLNRRANETKGAKTFTCRACTSPYKDGSGSGSGTEYNSRFCRVIRAGLHVERGQPKCEHGRSRSKCKECGTGQCQHGLWKSNCKDCGTNK
jgi:hypothetical protein